MSSFARTVPTGALGPWTRTILYADRGVIVLNKPSGLIAQAAKERAANASRGESSRDFNQMLRDLKQFFHLDTLPFPVHRLDKHTTGALVLARHGHAARELSRQFHNRTVDKIYLALVRGGAKSFSAKSGKIRVPLQLIDGRPSIGTMETGQPTSTDWELASTSATAPLSLLRLKLHTGFKHQLRIHLAECLKTPVLGDTVHSRNKLSAAITRIASVPEDRTFLHASQLSFYRYRKVGEQKRFLLTIKAPLPDDFLRICSEAKIHVNADEAEGGLFIDGERVNSIPDVQGKWLGQTQ